jgi:O-antigen/teichoic acid export membrane protein
VQETDKERLNRNLDQLLQELRVVIPGVQVLFAFLLAVPFATRFDRVDQFERVDYFVALLFAMLSVVLLLAPSMHHRILFRHEQKHYLVRVGSKLTIAGMTSLACSMTLSLVLVSHFLYGIWAAAIVAAFGIVAYGIVWYAIPLERRRHAPLADEPTEDDPRT